MEHTTIRISTVFYVLLALTLSAVTVSAVHDSSATLAPAWSPANANVDYTVNISNTGSDDPIDEVRIYMNEDYSNLTCPEHPLWQEVLIESSPDYCFYYADQEEPSEFIHPGETLAFDFSAVAPNVESCGLEWRFETRDDTGFGVGSYQELFAYTGVDNQEPRFTKVVTGPQMLNGEQGVLCPDGPGDGAYCHVTPDTTISVNVSDPGADECGESSVIPSGLEYCEVRVIVDDDEDSDLTESYTRVIHDNEAGDADENLNSIRFEQRFNEDSEHELVFTCYDRAGNVLEDSELFKVDSTAPDTDSEVLGPYHEDGGVEWIDTDSTIELSADDPEAEITPEDLTCAVGEDTTYYRWQTVEDGFCSGVSTEKDFIYGGGFESYARGAQKDDSAHQVWYVNGNASGGTDPESSSGNEGEWDYIHNLELPADAPLGHGALMLSIDNAGVAWRNYAHVGTRLEDIHTLGYWTYSENGNSFPTLQIEFDEDCVPTTYDGNLVFLPQDNADVDGDPASAGAWQQWNALNGTWTRSSDFSQEWTWSELLEEFPGACMRTSGGEGRLGVKLGTESTSETTYVDGVAFNDRVYDMEAQGTFLRYEGAFAIPEESCHAVEYYTVDRLGNEEDVNRRFLFVDKTAPEMLKEVQSPSVPMCDYREHSTRGVTTMALAGYGGEPFDFTEGIEGYFGWDAFESTVTSRTDGTVDFELSMPRSLDTEPDNLDLVIDAGNDGTPDFLVHYHVNPEAKNPTDTHWSIKDHDGIAFGGNEPLPEWISVASDTAGVRIFTISIDADRLGGCGATFGYGVQAPLADEGYPEDWTGEAAVLLFPENVGDLFGGSDDYASVTLGREQDWHVTTDTRIDLSCTDVGPHPSGEESVHFRRGLSDGAGGFSYETWQRIEDSSTGVYFEEPSLHVLEWYCEDAVNKTSEIDVEYFKVDDEAPVISKELSGPHMGPDCPAGTNQLPEHGDTGAECYVDSSTVVEVNVEDFRQGVAAEHSVDDVVCRYEMWWEDATAEPISSGSFGAEGANVSFAEDSSHELRIWCEDALGNEAQDFETFLVDMTPPETEKAYEGPVSVDDSGDAAYRWITSATDVELVADDEKAGVENLSYRVTQLIEDEHDLTYADCSVHSAHAHSLAQNISGDWTTVNANNTSFTIDRTSCHVIEYYAVDSLGHEEDVQFQVVLVDNEAPTFTKEVGEPSIFIGEGGDAELPSGECVASGFGGQVSPGAVDGALSDEQTCEVAKNVTTGETAAADPEIYFFVDTTGSMGSPISSVKSSIGAILDSVDADYGVGQYKDLTDPVAFSNEQSITSDQTAVESAIGSLGASGGGDFPEGQFYGFHRVAAENDAGFSADSTKILVWFGDAPGHDPICDSLISEGVNITEDSVIEALQDAGITVIAISTTTASGLDSSVGSGYSGCPNDAISGQATRIADATGGVHIEGVDSDEIVDAIIDAIGDATSTTDVVPDASACEALGVDVAFDPASYSDVGALTTVSFAETITRTATADGTVECDVHFRSGEGGGIIGTQTLTIGEDDAARDVGDGIDWFVNRDTDVSLSCADVLPHPIRGEKVVFSIGYEGDARGDEDTSLTGTYCTDVGGTYNETADTCIVDGTEVVFNYEEDSIHRLEAWCVDELGNENGIDVEWFAVDTLDPETTLDITGPTHEEAGVIWADNDTRFSLTPADPEPHPSGVNATYYRWNLVADEFCRSEELRPTETVGVLTEDAWTQYTEPFGIPEESCHRIEWYSVDNLGNTEPVQTEHVFMDHTPPVLDIEFGDPHLEAEGTGFISVDTKITVSAADPEPHPSGVNYANYRWRQVDDAYCDGTNETELAVPEGGYQPIDEGSETFSIPEESCHYIEIDAADNVAKRSKATVLIYVDDSAPRPNKTVGMPSSLLPQEYAWTYYPEVDGTCNTEGGTDCWKVTTMTPIEMACDDVEPHPSGVEFVYFNVGWDGGDITEEYCEAYSGTMQDNGYCKVDDDAVSEFLFGETTEHELSYYCEDAVGNSDEDDKDIEMFKVEEKAFEIQLNHKWNLISVPFRLLNAQMTEVFDQTEDVISVWGFDGREWKIFTPDGIANDDLVAMQPGYGYWVLTNGSENISIGGSLFSPAITPPSVNVVPGWNLLGYYGTVGFNASSGDDASATRYHGPSTTFGDPAYCALGTLQEGLDENRPVSVLSYWEPFNPDPWNTHDEDRYGLTAHDRMDPGAGYWVLSSVESIYTPATDCSSFRPDLVTAVAPELVS